MGMRATHDICTITESPFLWVTLIRGYLMGENFGSFWNWDFAQNGKYLLNFAQAYLIRMALYASRRSLRFPNGFVLYMHLTYRLKHFSKTWSYVPRIRILAGTDAKCSRNSYWLQFITLKKYTKNQYHVKFWSKRKTFLVLFFNLNYVMAYIIQYCNKKKNYPLE